MLDTYQFGNKTYYKNDYSGENLEEMKESYFKYLFWESELRYATLVLDQYKGDIHDPSYALHTNYIKDIERIIQLIENNVEQIHKLQSYSIGICENQTEMREGNQIENRAKEKQSIKRKVMSLFNKITTQREYVSFPLTIAGLFNRNKSSLK